MGLGVSGGERVSLRGGRGRERAGRRSWRVGLRVGSGGCWLLGGYQNLAQADLLGLLHLAFVPFVKPLLFLFADREMSADFPPDDLLRDDLVALVLLEILVGDALCLSSLLELLHRVKIHLLAHLIEFLDQFGVAGDAEILALLEKKLLVNEVA